MSGGGWLGECRELENDEPNRTDCRCGVCVWLGECDMGGRFDGAETEAEEWRSFRWRSAAIPPKTSHAQSIEWR